MRLKANPRGTGGASPNTKILPARIAFAYGSECMIPTTAGEKPHVLQVCRQKGFRSEGGPGGYTVERNAMSAVPGIVDSTCFRYQTYTLDL